MRHVLLLALSATILQGSIPALSSSDLVTTPRTAATVTPHLELQIELQNGPHIRGRMKARSGSPIQLLIPPHLEFKIPLDQRDEPQVTQLPGGWRRVHSSGVAGSTPFELEFNGTLPLEALSAKGAVLIGGEGWYPRPESVHTLDVQATLPHTWSTATSGKRLERKSLASGLVMESWKISRPQEALDWISAPFHVTTVNHGHLTLSTYFRSQDDALSKRFLELLPSYIDHYSREIAPYPYDGFSIVENIEETGFGMAGFTLLGPSVMRLPFLLNSSLPHEVLHNWWGNSVYVDYASGNWCEGLTTYQADHWQQELAGTDTEYRRAALSDYADYTKDGSDFPLRTFRGRHNASTQAVGYGKTMMLFHMLKIRFGEAKFREALKLFYHENVYRRASWADIQSAFERTTGEDIEGWLSPWLDRTGAARLTLGEVHKERRPVDRENEAGRQSPTWRACARIKEVNGLGATVPIQFTLASGATSRTLVALGPQSEVSHCVNLAEEPLEVRVDPRFDVFRVLEAGERPPSLSMILAADEIAIHHDPLTIDAPSAQAFAEAWQNALPARVTLVADTDTGSSTPAGRPAGTITVFLGASTIHRSHIAPLLHNYGVRVRTDGIELNGVLYPFTTHSFALTAFDTDGTPVVWVIPGTGQPLSELGRRLTHYGKFGALVFETAGGRANIIKRTWPIVNSPLTKTLVAH